MIISALYARVGIPHCPKCGKVIAKQTVDQMVDQIMELPERTRIQLLAPVVRGRKGTHAKLLDQARRSGYVRAEIDGNVYELSEEITLDKNIKHTIAIIVDRLIVKPGIEKRLTDSLETVLNLADGLAVVDTMDGNYMNFSQSFSCPDCESVLMRSSQEVFRLITHLGPARSALALVIRWNLTRIL